MEKPICDYLMRDDEKDFIEQKAKNIEVSRRYMSARLFHCLTKAGYKNLYEVMTADPVDILEIRNFGSECQKELEKIINIVKNCSEGELQKRLNKFTVKYDISAFNGDDNLITCAYGKKIAEDAYVCTNKDGESVLDYLITRADLSTRAYNCLKRGKALELKRLSHMRYAEIISFCGLGENTITEILQLIKKQTRLVQDTDIIFNSEAYLSINEIPDNWNMISCAYGYKINEDEYFCIEKSGNIVQDYVINKEDISVRAFNCINTLEIRSLRELCETACCVIQKVRYLGDNTFNNLLYFIKSQTRLRKKYIISSDKLDEINKIADKVEGFLKSLTFTEINEAYKKLIVDLLVEHCMTRNGQIVFNAEIFKDVIKSDIFSELVVDGVYNFLGTNSYDCVTREAIEDRFCKLDKIENGYVLNLLKRMENDHLLMIREGYYYRYRESLSNWVSALYGNSKVAVSLKISGCTLEEIGCELGVTRERARQIILKAVNQRPALFEDGYIDVFNNYAFSDEEFKKIFNVENEVINYIKIVSKRSKEACSLKDFVLDASLPDIYRERASELLKRNTLVVDGEFIALKRDTILKWCFKKYCSDSDYTISEFEEFYYSFLDENGIQNNDNLTFPSKHAFEARVMDLPYCVSKYGKRIRYFEVESLDFDELIENLRLYQYNNSEISTLKVFIENQDYLEGLDIRDEYELHNILRKYCDHLKAYNVKVGRMPLITIGAGDRNRQVRELLYQMAPVSKDELALEYEIRYGVKKETVSANFFNEIDIFLDNGIFDVNRIELPVDEFNQLKEILIDDFYMWNDVVEIYENIIKGKHSEAINSATLKKLGFKVLSEYVISNIYQSADDYFTKLLIKDKEIYLSSLKTGMRSIQAFYVSLNSLRDDLELIEIEKNHFIRFDYFTKTIIECSKSTLAEIGKNIIDNNHENLFAIKGGEIGEIYGNFAEKIDNIYFINSLIRIQQDIRTNFIGNVCVVAKNGKDPSLTGILLELLNEKKAFDIDELLNEIRNRYGIKVHKNKVLFFLSKEKSVQIDPIMGIVKIIDKPNGFGKTNTFWTGTPYENLINEARTEIDQSRTTIAGVYWKDRFRSFVKKCNDQRMFLMKDLIDLDIESICLEFGISLTITSEIISLYISWIRDLQNKEHENGSDIISMFFK